MAVHPDDDSRHRVRSPDPTLGRTRPTLRPVAVERVPGVPAHLKSDPDTPTKPKRQRVVLDGGPSAVPAPPLRSRVELAEQTSWGEMLIRDLISAQLRLALIFALACLLLLGGLPVTLWLLPGFAGLAVAGVPVVWLLLAVALFPLLGMLAWLHTRFAERHERAFTDMIEA